MRRHITKIICAAAALISALAITFTSACSDTYKTKALKGDNIFTSEEAVSNGGFAVEKGDYIYFINGVESNTSDNTFGSVVKGAIMRISKSDFSQRNYSSVDTVVSQIAYSGNTNAGLFIYGDYIYYATPSTEKNSDGEIQNSYLTFRSAKLDGTNVMKSYYAQYSDNTIEYRYVQADDGVVYLVYVATSETLYEDSDAGSCTNIHSVNTQTGVNTLLAYNVNAVYFDDTDVTNPRIYYTMGVEDFKAGIEYSEYNQIWTVTADATVPNTYDFSDIEDYDADEDPLYINCGDLVYDGIGIELATTGSATQFNASDAEDSDHVSYTYTIAGYQGGMLFYTRSNSTDSTEKLFAEKESTLLASGHSAVTNNLTDGELFIRDGSNASLYNYMFDENGELDYVIIADSTGFIRANVKDGQLMTDIDNKEGGTYYMTKSGQPTVLFFEGNYVYYSLTGGNGYQVYRIDYTGTYEDYNKLNLGDTTEYTEIQILDLDSSSSWYLPEMFDNQIIFASETENMTSYNYIMACDLRNSSGDVMTNAEIESYNELYDSVAEAIEDIDEDVYENLQNALWYLYYNGDKDYIYDLIELYVDIMDYDEEHFWSKESLAIYESFAAAASDGDFADFADAVKVNGEDVKANRRDYYYALLGVMSDDDAEDYEELIKTTYLQSEPEEEGWYDSLSTGEKAGFIIGVCAGGLIVLGGIAVLVILLLKKRRKSAPVSRKRIKVDTTDDKDMDVYNVDNESGTPTDGEQNG